MSKNPHAVALGKLARGRPKKFSQAEIERRTQQLVKARAIRALLKHSSKAGSESGTVVLAEGGGSQENGLQ